MESLRNSLDNAKTRRDSIVGVILDPIRETEESREDYHRNIKVRVSQQKDRSNTDESDLGLDIW